MIKWRFDTENMPKGEQITKYRKGKNGLTYPIDIRVTPKLIVASGTCDTVTITRWIPKNGTDDEGRWEMFPEGETPHAWAYWPDHPRHQNQPRIAA